MAKEYDAGLNGLIDAHLADWAAYLTARLGLPAGPAEALDTDLSATLQADRLFRIAGPTPFVLHLELESSGRLGIPEELLRYHVAARKATGVPVMSAVVMLRPKATATDLDGVLDLPDPAGGVCLTFRYGVIRLWQEPFDRVLASGLGLAPLALLTNEAAADLPAAVARFHARLKADAPPANVVRDLLGYTSVIGGLRYDLESFRRLVMGGRNVLEDSTVYQWILGIGKDQGRVEGKAEEARRLLVLLARNRFGDPPAAAGPAIDAVTDPTRLERMTLRVLTAAGWDDLLATP